MTTVSANGPSATLTGDVAERIRLLEQRLVESQRLALAGTTAAMLAHEFNNLMTPVLARSRFAIDRADPLLALQTLERTVVQVEKAITLSRYLLRLTNPGAAEETATCTVAEVIDNALGEAVRPFEKDGMAVEVECPDDLRLRGQALLVEQVLLNLLLNARKAMSGRRGRIHIAVTREAGLAKLDVADAGIGMDPVWRREVLNPFLAADPETDAANWPQVGLGLHVCRVIAREHDATLQADDNPAGGCTMRLRWPVAE